MGAGKGRGSKPTLVGGFSPCGRSSQVLARSQKEALPGTGARARALAAPPAAPPKPPGWSLFGNGALVHRTTFFCRLPDGSRLSPAPLSSPIAVRVWQGWVEPRKFERSSAPREPVPGNREVVEEKHPAWTVRRGGKWERSVRAGGVAGMWCREVERWREGRGREEENPG